MSETAEVRRGMRIAELSLVGGHAAIDLVNTVEPRLPVPSEDHLGTPDDLLTWARRAGIAEEEELAGVIAAWGTSPGAAARAFERGEGGPRGPRGRIVVAVGPRADRGRDGAEARLSGPPLGVGGRARHARAWWGERRGGAPQDRRPSALCWSKTVWLWL